MKRNLDHKIELPTETLLPLQANALDGVVGGAAGITTLTSATTIVTRISCLLCVPRPGSQ